MCSVCGGKAKPKPGQKLPSKAIACEQCTAQIKKSIREEMERETPTKRFLMKFASHLSTQLPVAIVQNAMKMARGHAGGTGKITKKVVTVEKSAGILDKDLVNYSDEATDEQKRVGRICTSCSFFDVEGNEEVCQIVEGNIKPLGTCELFKPGEYIVVKSQPDSRDVHVDSLLNDEDLTRSICKFESPEE